MPIYEFRCLKCGEVFEYLAMKSEDEEEMRCPHCRHTELERVMSRASFNVGGGGAKESPSVKERHCSGGSCQTITLPGHSK